MYVPKHFAVDNLSAHDLIDACDFGVVVSSGLDGLFATHIPLMLKRDEGRFGTLYGHVARANPHVKLFGSEALAVFAGPHAYVSPTWYSDRSANVPTWNYVAVHCTGTPVELEGDVRVHLGEMVGRYEGADGWSFGELAPQTQVTMPRAIVGFRMEITRIEGKAKLSQNKPRAERERLIEGLRAAGDDPLAAIMEQQLNLI
jgi:transcriptional regulator